MDKKFQILESILFENGNYFLLDYHLSRFNETTLYFNFPNPQILLQEKLNNFQNDHKTGPQSYKIRLLLDETGIILLENTVLDKIQSAKILLSDSIIDSKEVFLYHKTTNRDYYRDSNQIIFENGLADLIYMNEKEELTEGSRTNIFFQLDGMLYTPPLTCGLLPGTYRQFMIDQGKVKEKILKKKDINKVEQFYIGNSVRGILKVFF